MKGEAHLLALAHEILRVAKAEGVEVVLIAEQTDLTRFSRSQIHQNTGLQSLLVGIRIRENQKAAVAWSSDTSKDGIRALVRRAQEALAQAPEDPSLPPLQGPSSLPQLEHPSVYEESLAFGPKERAELARQAFEIVGDKGEVYGTISSGVAEFGYLNTQGVEAYQAVTDVHATINVKTPNQGSGWAQFSTPRASQLNITQVTERALQKAIDSEHPQDWQAGEFPVLLEPLAYRDLLVYVSYAAFSAKLVQEKRSCLVGKFGKQAFQSSLTIVDDPSDPRTFPRIFDWEGTPKRPIPLIENGVPIQPAYDLRTAQHDRVSSTGHSMFPFQDFPLPLHLHVSPGARSIEEILPDLDEAILITRLWYINVVDPMTLTLTGMTRDGTFLIRNGKIVKPIKNLRFTESMVRLWESAFEHSQEREVIAPTTYYGFRNPHGMLVPYVYFPKFRFTGTTEF